TKSNKTFPIEKEQMKGLHAHMNVTPYMKKMKKVKEFLIVIFYFSIGLSQIPIKELYQCENKFGTENRNKKQEKKMGNMKNCE
ncbi:hypothetical protein ACJX0J_021961, partial [Zea mays]